MKTILSFMLFLACMVGLAQDKVYVHTTTASNTSGHITNLNHPDLNGNPNAGLVFVNNYNPGGIDAKYNNNVAGLWYDGVKWTIYNEDLSPMEIGAHFNVYIADDPSDVITHIATPANIIGHVTIMDHPLLNGNNPGPYLAMSHYYNPNAVYNTGNFGQYYLNGTRRLYDENFTAMPEGAAFKVLITGGAGSSRISHTSTAASISSNYTIIDSPLLNDNPNATFVMSHYWGIGGPPTEVYLNSVLGVWYTGTRWAIYLEDTAEAFPENVAFDIIIAPQDVLAVDDFQTNVNISMYPNPAKNSVTFNSTENIEKISIYSILGNEVLSVNVENQTKDLDISHLSSGTYLAKVKTANNAQTLKLIKQ